MKNKKTFRNIRRMIRGIILKAITAAAAFLLLMTFGATDADTVTVLAIALVCAAWLLLYAIANTDDHPAKGERKKTC